MRGTPLSSLEGCKMGGGKKSTPPKDEGEVRAGGVGVGLDGGVSKM